MQIPVFIVETRYDVDGNVILDEDGEPLKFQKNLILLHWGLWVNQYPVGNDNNITMPLSSTCAICKDPDTGATIELTPTSINFFPDERINV